MELKQQINDKLALNHAIHSNLISPGRPRIPTSPIGRRFGQQDAFLLYTRRSKRMKKGRSCLRDETTI